MSRRSYRVYDLQDMFTEFSRVIFQAAAALCVKVGSFSDPKELPGLAHLLEHMVFMGSEKYPTENDFDAFIKVNEINIEFLRNWR